MKRLSLGLLFVFLTSILFACSSGDPVSFTDEHLEEAIRTEIEKPEGDIYESDLDDIVKLDLSEEEIEDIDGIDAIGNLETLSLEDNDISDFTPLSDLYDLDDVTVIGNPFFSDDEQVELLEDLNDQGITVKMSVGEPDGPGGFLWKVENNDTTVYLQGTIHVGKDEMFPMNEEIENAYMASDIVVPEIDFNEVSMGEIQQINEDLGTYDDGSVVSDHISNELYDELENTLNELGDLPIDLVKQYKPWLLANTIQQLMSQELGYISGVDEYFLNRTQEDEKEVIGLETVEEQLSILADISPEMQEDQLEESLMDIDEYDEQMDELLSLYMDGDVDDLLDNLLMEDGLEEDDGHATEEEIEFMEALNDDRNEGMAEQIAEFLEEDDDQTYFVIIGTLHLTQEPHVRSILEEDGYEIEHIL